MLRRQKDTVRLDSYQRTRRDIRYQGRWEKLMRMLKTFPRSSHLLHIRPYPTEAPLLYPSVQKPKGSLPHDRIFSRSFLRRTNNELFSRYKTWFVGLSLSLCLPSLFTLFLSRWSPTLNFLKRREVSRSRTLISLAALLITHGVLSFLPPIEALLSSLFSATLYSITPTFASCRQPLRFYILPLALVPLFFSVS